LVRSSHVKSESDFLKTKTETSITLKLKLQNNWKTTTEKKKLGQLKQKKIVKLKVIHQNEIRAHTGHHGKGTA